MASCAPDGAYLNAAYDTQGSVHETLAPVDFDPAQHSLRPIMLAEARGRINRLFLDHARTSAAQAMRIYPDAFPKTGPLRMVVANSWIRSPLDGCQSPSLLPTMPEEVPESFMQCTQPRGSSYCDASI